ncbi:hypothetical protein [Sphingomonas sp.]|jgi:hypothetical protein|uniref:hypothetical protein n=1 Tax=Sphingomonas sp. TaxID=28214 RepID=UPI00261F0C2C|nr:hypothetical protein [Sphingomonas sp.]MDF2495047.1 hypothetical protein [Sphingomonas sp.]
MRGPAPSAVIERALLASAAQRRLAVAIEPLGSAAWYSATFAGERYAMALTTLASDAARDWLACVPDMDVTLPGCMLAGLSVTEASEQDGQCHAQIEAITVERA